MAERIRKHKAERDARWSVIETRDDLPAALAEAEAKGADFIIIDCLTLWTSNIVCCAPETFDAKLAALLEAVKATKPPLALVTNEVGLGIVPGDPLSRAFRDAAGTVNRKVAEIVDAVYLTVCGIPLKIK
jgi:adenosylcobinamide kinase/adenosylcobinamide-phosphate guanylyltransferase